MEDEVEHDDVEEDVDKDEDDADYAEDEVEEGVEREEDDAVEDDAVEDDIVSRMMVKRMKVLKWRMMMMLWKMRYDVKREKDRARHLNAWMGAETPCNVRGRPVLPSGPALPSCCFSVCASG